MSPDRPRATRSPSIRAFASGNAQTWQVSIQRDLPKSLVATATYLGTKGTRGIQELLPNSYPVGRCESLPGLSRRIPVYGFERQLDSRIRAVPIAAPSAQRVYGAGAVHVRQGHRRFRAGRPGAGNPGHRAELAGSSFGARSFQFRSAPPVGRAIRVYERHGHRRRRPAGRDARAAAEELDPHRPAYGRQRHAAHTGLRRHGRGAPGSSARCGRITPVFRSTAHRRA